ncbi:MAG: HAD family hydrolase [Clostridia bacterium]|nr:HAD family hydrolase [Clostridia bacterium]
MTPKAVIFDLDGTLLDTLSDLTYAVNVTLERRGYPTRTSAEVRSFIGDGAEMLIRRALPAVTDEAEVKAATAEYKQIYLDNLLRETAPYAGIPEMLAELKRRGIKSAVVSNKYYKSTKELCDIFFKDIDGVMGEMEECGIKRKPAPDMLLRVMDELGAAPENTLYSGDSDVDVITAGRAGVKCISVTWGFQDEDRLRSAGAEYVAHHPSEIISIIDSI